MDTIIGLAILFAIGWAISKSKVLSGLLDGLGVAMNWLWGSLFIVGGIWGLISGWGIWIPLLCMAVGVYFFTTSRFDTTVGDSVRVLVEALSDKVADRLSPDGASEPSVTSGDTGAPARPKKPSPQLVLLVIGIVGVVYGLWGLQNAGEVTTTYTFEGTTPADFDMNSTTDVDTGGTLPWLALLGGGAALAVAQAIERREGGARKSGTDASDVIDPTSPPLSVNASTVPAETAEAEVTATCPACGAEVLSDGFNCDKCGVSVWL
ncbi:MAG: hypothetical protein U1E29_14950 [Coriobacteriia bacterium]|nr:hypothetical protein [Coriobacteriia bacterium]